MIVSPAPPPGHQRKDQLAAQLEELDAATSDLREALTFVNAPGLRPHAEALADGASAVIAAYRDRPFCGPEIADNLAGLLSAARALRLPAQDPDLGRTLPLQKLRASKGLIVSALGDALETTQALGLQPRRPTLPEQFAIEVPRDNNLALLAALSKRLDDVVERLDALDDAKAAPTNFEQQRELLGFYVGAMRVEVSLVKMHIKVGENAVDFGALGRAVEVMTELTGDFSATVRAWMGRVTVAVTRGAEEMSRRVRRVAVGTGTIVKRARRMLQMRVDLNPNPPRDPLSPFPSRVSRNLEQTLHGALDLARTRWHQYATLEHLLLALVDDVDASSVLLACRVDIEKLRSDLTEFLDKDLAGLARDRPGDPKPTAGFQRVVQRAARESNLGETNGAEVLMSLFSERESHALYFLQLQDITRLDVVNFLSQGIAKAPKEPQADQAPGGILSRNLEQTLHGALDLARTRRHEYATLEHLLLALVDDVDASSVLLACRVDIEKLRSDLTEFLDKDLAGLVWDRPGDPKPTPEFQRVVQRAALFMQSSSRYEITDGALVLKALFSERESHAVSFLELQDMTRLDVVNFLSQGVVKP